MRTIGRVLEELLLTFWVGLVSFFVMIAMVAGFLALCVLWFFLALFVIVAVAESIYWLLAHNHHAGVAAIQFWLAGATTLGLTVMIFRGRDMLLEWPQRRRERHNREALERIAQLRVAPDESFDPSLPTQR